MKHPRSGRRSGKGEDKRKIVTRHRCKDLSNHYNQCKIDVHTKDKCWKLHPNLIPKNRKKDASKKNVMATNLSNQMENNSDVDEETVYTSINKGVNLSFNNSKRRK